MPEINPEFIERYQILYQQNSRSRIFAPLVEAYRQMKMYKQALEVGEKGVLENSDFAGGRVALAQVYYDLQQFDKAQSQLVKATHLAPENKLAFSLLAECEVKLKRPQQALRAYKMLLFLNPQNFRAQKAIKKLESLTAEDYEEEVFSMIPLGKMEDKSDEVSEKTKPEVETKPQVNSLLERYISLADAFLARNDIEKAQKSLREAEVKLGPQNEILKRYQWLQNRQSEPEMDLQPLPSRTEEQRDRKLEFLRQLLHQIDLQQK